MVAEKRGHGRGATVLGLTHLRGGGGFFTKRSVAMMEGPQMQQGQDFLRAPPAPPATTNVPAAPAEFGGRPNVIFDGTYYCIVHCCHDLWMNSDVPLYKDKFGKP